MKLGVIGLGLRATGLLTAIEQADDDAVVTSVCDILPQETLEERLKENKIRTSRIQFFQTPAQLLSYGDFDALIIATNCNTHADIAIQAFEAKVPIFLEKPVATDQQSLLKLQNAEKQFKPNVLVSFPLRVTPLATLAKELIEQGEIGTVEQVQAFNNVPYGRVYYKSWYRDSSITNGLWLQKATHDFDYITHILGRTPVQICAMSTKQIFKGDHPANLKCTDCPEYQTCPESTWVIRKILKEDPLGEYCSFATDTGNQDCGSAIIRFDTGMHAVYSQNFFARKSAATRGARFLGYRGTLEFDWYTNQLKIFRHQTDRTDTYEFTGESSHFGGDEFLARSLMEMVYQKKPSVAPLRDGILSAQMCLAAKKSCQENCFVSI